MLFASFFRERQYRMRVTNSSGITNPVEVPTAVNFSFESTPIERDDVSTLRYSN
jgi:hypothetical protein